MSNNSSFNSEELSDDSIEEDDTKSQTDKDKEKAKGNSPENGEIKNLNLIDSIVKTLDTILEKNKTLKNYKDIIKRQSSNNFSANTIPNITIKDYLIRIQNYSEVEKSTLIMSLILIDKMCRKSEILLTHYNIHRILFSAVLISINIMKILIMIILSILKLQELNQMNCNYWNIHFLNIMILMFL